MNSPKVVFAGTPDFAAVCLKRLISEGYTIVSVYTQPDKKSGRGKKVSMSPVKELALSHNIPVEQPLNFKEEEAITQLANYEADIMIVVAYGIILPKEVLTTPKLGCINVHASLLPRWRGAAPIQRAIESGDTETGVGIMQMDEGLDTGPVWIEKKCAIDSSDTGSSLHDKLATLGSETLINILPKITNPSNQLSAIPQDELGVTYAHKLVKSEAEIDWTLSAVEIERKVRAFNSWPVGYFFHNQTSIKVWKASVISEKADSMMVSGTIIQSNKRGIQVACGRDSLLLEELQLAGSKRMTSAELLNSKAHWFEIGQLLGKG